MSGEPSGDVIGGALMRALRREVQGRVSLEFSGVGGPRMQREGLRSLFPMKELSVMGFGMTEPF